MNEEYTILPDTPVEQAVFEKLDTVIVKFWCYGYTQYWVKGVVLNWTWWRNQPQVHYRVRVTHIGRSTREVPNSFEGWHAYPPEIDPDRIDTVYCTPRRMTLLEEE